MKKEELKEQDIISKIYQAQEEIIDNIIRKTDEKIKSKLEKIEIEKIIKDSNCSKELKEILKETFKKIEDNENIKITEYNKQIYKQGFIDGVRLMQNCIDFNKCIDF